MNFKNIDINGCPHENYLISLQGKSQLTFCNGCIEDNIGSKSIFYVGTSCKLRLIKNRFKNNMVKNTYQPCCINSEAFSAIVIKECDFLDHNSNDYVQSPFIIDSKGHLSITSSTFENNMSDIIDENSMIVSTVILFL